ncbi:LruC domain-containing protein [Mucilaginibacter gynuensis]|uniref:LruC domain-containing protein n=1 Tax=Mucilaginibacter gynuensis TaxID=1302236 RepID=A0ABP8H5F4_9SPHI
MKKHLTLLIALAVTGMVSCKKDVQTGSDNTTPTTAANGKAAPDGFNFKTSNEVNVNITLRANNDEPLSNVLVRIFDPANTNADEALYTGMTDNAGNIQAKVNVPAGLSQVIIDPAYVGLMRNAIAKINGSATTVVIGGKTTFSGDIIAQAVTQKNRKIFSTGTQAVTSTQFVYPAPYTSASDAIYDDANFPLYLGVPKYKETQRANITPLMLKYINASLPESVPVEKLHPKYLTKKAVPTINVIKTSEVDVTFISEGATYQNTLAYYTYPTNNPPKNANDIKKATFVFPNTSAAGSGGALQAGDQVKLGTFEAGTTIAFIVLRNSWTGSSIQTDVDKFYSIDAFNPETDNTIKKHTVVLNDDVHNHFVVGFEDIARNEAICDHDFNDIVFYAKATVADAIDPTDIPIIDKGTDTDGDGVSDEADQYPNDPERAFDSYYPSKTRFAQVAFEDNWPKKGDYDMNDLVIDYRYKFVLNAKNQVVDLQGLYVPIAAGASFKNGFGVQFPVPASAVKRVRGQQLIGNYIKRTAEGNEAGQSKAVIIPFDNHDAVLSYFDGSYFVNTKPEKDKVEGKRVTVTINFNAPIDQSALSVADFNPFLISNLNRGAEVHLPGYLPTDLANAKLFGTDDDSTNPAANRYYLSPNNLPWAISYQYSVKYPIEGVNINDAYLHFNEWAMSAGRQYPEWYTNEGAGYRDVSKLYQK